MRSCAGLLVALFGAAMAWGVPGAVASVELEEVGHFEQPIFVTSQPGDVDHLLVVERAGFVIEATPNGRTVFADLTPWVINSGGEEGLFSIALAPDFSASGRFYAAYSGRAAAGSTEGDLHVDAFRRSGASLLREPVIAIERNPERANHYGGQVAFGPDGRLYISVGDGGGGGDPDANAQDPANLLGTILRIAPRPGTAEGYAVPDDNPFVGSDGAADEIWAFGLRNPWRISFDRQTGDLTVADVGQSAWEEVNFAPSPSHGIAGGAGANYGWNCREGFHPYEGANAPSDCPGSSSFDDPVFAYPNTRDDPGDGTAYGCSITGGYVVRDPALESLYGRYVYSDFCAGELRSLQLPASAGEQASDDRLEVDTGGQPISFGQDSCGRLYIATIDGAVQRLVGTGVNECVEGSGDDGGSGNDGGSGDEGEIGGNGGSGDEGPGAQPIAGSPRARRVLARLGRRWVPMGGRALLAARLAPCAGSTGRRAILYRFGRPVAVRRLNRRCIARFTPRIRRHGAYRVVAWDPARQRPIASRRLIVLRRLPGGS